MDGARVDYRYISYPGAVHAFTNAEATALGKKFNIPIAYNADADKKSAAKAKKFVGLGSMRVLGEMTTGSRQPSR